MTTLVISGTYAKKTPIYIEVNADIENKEAVKSALCQAGFIYGEEISDLKVAEHVNGKFEGNWYAPTISYTPNKPESFTIGRRLV